MSTIEESVIARIRERAAKGEAKYGTTMDRTDLSTVQWMRHAQEELLDAAVYLEKLIRDEELRTLTEEERCFWTRTAGCFWIVSCGRSSGTITNLKDGKVQSVQSCTSNLPHDQTTCPFCGKPIVIIERGSEGE
jgi:hypothetical protein